MPLNAISYVKQRLTHHSNVQYMASCTAIRVSTQMRMDSH